MRKEIHIIKKNVKIQDSRNIFLGWHKVAADGTLSGPFSYDVVRESLDEDPSETLYRREDVSIAISQAHLRKIIHFNSVKQNQINKLHVHANPSGEEQTQIVEFFNSTVPQSAPSQLFVWADTKFETKVPKFMSNAIDKTVLRKIMKEESSCDVDIEVHSELPQADRNSIIRIPVHKFIVESFSSELAELMQSSTAVHRRASDTYFTSLEHQLPHYAQSGAYSPTNHKGREEEEKRLFHLPDVKPNRSRVIVHSKNPECIKILFSFLYGESISLATKDLQFVCDLLYEAERFKVDSLSSMCLSRFSRPMSCEEILDFAYALSRSSKDSILDECASLIIMNIQEILTISRFYRLPLSMLHRIFSSDLLLLPESQIVISIQLWALVCESTSQCTEVNKNTLYKQIRFGNLSSNQLQANRNKAFDEYILQAALAKLEEQEINENRKDGNYISQMFECLIDEKLHSTARMDLAKVPSPELTPLSPMDLWIKSKAPQTKNEFEKEKGIKPINTFAAKETKKLMRAQLWRSNSSFLVNHKNTSFNVILSKKQTGSSKDLFNEREQSKERSTSRFGEYSPKGITLYSPLRANESIDPQIYCWTEGSTRLISSSNWSFQVLKCTNNNLRVGISSSSFNDAYTSRKAWYFSFEDMALHSCHLGSEPRTVSTESLHESYEEGVQLEAFDVVKLNIDILASQAIMRISVYRLDKEKKMKVNMIKEGGESLKFLYSVETSFFHSFLLTNSTCTKRCFANISPFFMLKYDGDTLCFPFEF